MILVDSHGHIYTKEFKDDIGDVIERAKEAGVEKIYMPNVDHESIESMMNLAQKYPGYCIPMMGLHPCSVEKDFEKHLYEVEELLSKEKFVAVGEMGTDLYWDKTFYEQQKEAFNIQCELALKNQLNKILSQQTGQSLKTIAKDTDRDNFMSAQDALKYGIVDNVIEKRE